MLLEGALRDSIGVAHGTVIVEVADAGSFDEQGHWFMCAYVTTNGNLDAARSKPEVGKALCLSPL